MVTDVRQEGAMDGSEGYSITFKKMYVCDGVAIPANPGVNPSLTITAMTERAMSLIPEKKS